MVTTRSTVTPGLANPPQGHPVRGDRPVGRQDRGLPGHQYTRIDVPPTTGVVPFTVVPGRDTCSYVRRAGDI